MTAYLNPTDVVGRCPACGLPVVDGHATGCVLAMGRVRAVVERMPKHNAWQYTCGCGERRHFYGSEASARLDLDLHVSNWHNMPPEIRQAESDAKNAALVDEWSARAIEQHRRVLERRDMWGKPVSYVERLETPKPDNSVAWLDEDLLCEDA